MKKFVVSMGLAAAGSAAFQMTCAAQLLSTDAPKLWNVSASLDGFYDDNYSTTATKRGSFGFEVSPSVSANVPLTQTEIGVSYTYDLQYYQEREELNQNPVDQSHAFNLWLDHSFNELWSAKVDDNFVSGQEPELVNGGTPYRLEGNNIANNAIIELDTEWTRELSTALTYGNNFYDYDDSTLTGLSTVPGDSSVNASYAGELNRVENLGRLDVQWHFTPETMAFIGYQFEVVNYTGDQVIGYYNYNSAGLPVPPAIANKSRSYDSSSRDNLSHFGYAGLQRNLLPNLVLAAKAGVQYNDAYNNPLYTQSGFDPYADVSLIYSYLTGCNAQIGFTQMRNATDIVSVSQANGSITQDQESSSLHASINHRLTPKLLVSAIGTFTSSTYDGGGDANEVDDDYGLGLSAVYSFTRNFSGTFNYNYDNLSSNIIDRGFERNRVSIGLSVTY